AVAVQAAAAALPAGRTAAPFAKAAFQDSGTPKSTLPVSAASGGLPESTILDRWKDTGKPLN
ncbi:MAG: cell wall hydrolase, partial [Pseudomonadota bacterium]